MWLTRGFGTLQSLLDFSSVFVTTCELRPISELIEGDLVLAWDEVTGKTGYFVITNTISHVDPEIVLLILDGEALETTAEHTFYVVEVNEWSSYLSVGKWIDAGALQVGDDVLQADGTTGEVRSVQVVAQSQWMYNLTIDQAHTFFVGEGQWLVHNCSFTRPHDRHYLNKITQSTVAKDLNTVIEPGVDIAGDVAAINAGKASRVGNNYLVNGRTYGYHENGTLIPISGTGLHQLNRASYKSLGVYNKFGNSARATEILDNMGISLADREAALNVWTIGQSH